MASELLYEYMLRVQSVSLICRIWRQCPLADDYDGISNWELKEWTKNVLERNISIKDIAAIIIAHYGVNSVEIIHTVTGDGICVHKDWP